MEHAGKDLGSDNLDLNLLLRYDLPESLFLSGMHLRVLWSIGVTVPRAGSPGPLRGRFLRRSDNLLHDDLLAAIFLLVLASTLLC